MKTGIKDFLIKYKEKLENDKDIKENNIDYSIDHRDRISFNLNVKSSDPISFPSFDQGKNLFELDNEDIEYLYNKYSKKIDSELQQNIEKIKEEYKNLI